MSLTVLGDGVQSGQELLVAGHLRGDYAELGPVVALQQAEDGTCLMLDRRRDLECQRVFGVLKNGIRSL